MTQVHSKLQALAKRTQYLHMHSAAYGHSNLIKAHSSKAFPTRFKQTRQDTQTGHTYRL